MTFAGDTLTQRVITSCARGTPLDLKSTPDRPVRADLIRDALASRVDSRGVVGKLHLRNAQVVGSLNLEGLRSDIPILFESCTFTETIVLRDAHVRDIRFTDTFVPGIQAQNVKVAECMEFVEGSHSSGKLDLVDAEIGGFLRFTRSTIEAHGDDIAIDLGRARIAWRVSLAEARVVGMTRLVATRVGGTLSFRAAVLEAKGIAVAGERLRVEESLFMQSVHVKGLFSLLNAAISGGVDATRASFSRPGETCLSARRATVGRNFGCTGAEFSGNVRFDSCRVVGALSLHQAVFTEAQSSARAHNATGSRIRLKFQEPPTSLDLSHAVFRTIEDKPESWPPQIDLDNCTYDFIDSPGGIDAKTRLKWLTRSQSAAYHPGPYATLLKMYERIGDDKSKRKVALADQRRRRRTLAPPGRAAGHFLDATVGYGYQNWRAAVGLAILVALGTILFSYWPAAPASAGVPTVFNPFWFTLDEVLPIVDLGQKKNWVAQGPVAWLGPTLVLSGWTLTTALVAGLTRFLGKK